jgi:hypothetical protein
VVRIQFPVVQKFNQNIMARSLPLNFKHAYQIEFVSPFSLLFFKNCLQQNVLQIVIVILLCRSENTPNFIIMLSLDRPRRVATISCWVLLLLCFLFGIRTFFGICSYVGSSCCNGPSCCCCKSSHPYSSLELEIKIEPTYSFVPASFLSFLKLYFLKVSLQFLLLFFNHFKSFPNLDNGEDLWEEKE